MGTRYAVISQYWLQLRHKRALRLLAGLLILFVALAIVARSPGLLHLDREVSQEVQERHSAPLDFIAYFFTFLGEGVSLTILCCGVALFLWRTGQKSAAIFSLLALIGLPLNLLLKLLVQRPRPSADLVRIVITAQGSSFPSGHAMGSVIVYGFFAYLAWACLVDVPRRRFWTAVCLTAPVCISLSRIYLGVHWFSDVLGGWFFGLIVLFLLVDSYNFVKEKRRTARDRAV